MGFTNQKQIEKILSFVIIPTILWLPVQVIITLLSLSLSAILLCNALFSLVLASRLTSENISWKETSMTLGSIGLISGFISSIITWLTTFSASTFFSLFTDPFLFFIINALCAAIAGVLFPSLKALYQK